VCFDLAFTWAFIVGEWQAVVKELKLKKHGYPPKSIFRLGLNLLRRLVANFEHFDVFAWNKIIKLLSCSQVTNSRFFMMEFPILRPNLRFFRLLR
jgi:hypothetical protein